MNLLLALLLAAMIASCAPIAPVRVDAPATLGVQPQATIATDATDTATPTSSSTATVTATPSLTPSLTPSSTQSSTPSIVPSHTSTPRPTRPISTITVQPTPLPALANAPLYPSSPIQPWDQAAFVAAVSASRSALHDFLDYFGAVAGGRQGDCGIYWGYYGRWEAQPGFTDVPNTWYTSYYAYRQILDRARTSADPITKVCIVGQGYIDPRIDQVILTAFNALVPEIDQLYLQVASQ